MLSNTFLRSMKDACTFPLVSFCIYISCSMTKDWVTHEWCFLKPAWFGESISFSFVCFSNLSYKRLLTTFVHTLESEIGLCCIGFLYLSCLLVLGRYQFATYFLVYFVVIILVVSASLSWPMPLVQHVSRVRLSFCPGLGLFSLVGGL